MNHLLEFWRKKSSNPMLILASILAGTGLGWWYRGLSESLGVISDIYIDLLKMITMPFMIAAVTYSLGQLMNAGNTAKLLGRVAKLFFFGMLGCALLGLACAIVMGPGRDMSSETLGTLGQLVGEDISAGSPIEMPLTGRFNTDSMSFQKMVLSLIPSNIFAALTQGETLKVLVFSMLFGFVVGRLPNDSARPLTDALRGVFDACLKLTIWLNYLLPVVLLTMIAKQVATSGLEAFQAMGSFILTLGLACLVLILLSLYLIRWASGASWRAVLASQRESLVMAIATRNSPACMPLMIGGLTEKLGFPARRIELMVPLAISLLRLGPVLNYTIIPLFIAQMYGRQLTLSELGAIAIGATLTGFASSGMTGFVAISLTGIVCSYIGLPFTTLIVLFIAIDPLTDTFRTAVNVAGANAFAALASKGSQDEALPQATGKAAQPESSASS